jgi:very-short-patch-repair endonuclease
LARDAVLAREGFRTLRFLAVDVMGNLEGVSVAIREALGVLGPSSAPCPTPTLPKQGREKK